MTDINRDALNVKTAFHILSILSDCEIRSMKNIHKEASMSLFGIIPRSRDPFYYTCSRIMTTILRNDLGYIHQVSHGKWQISESGLSFLQKMKTP